MYKLQQICITSHRSMCAMRAMARELEQIGTTRNHASSLTLRGKVTESSIWPMNRPANDHRACDVRKRVYRMSHINRAIQTGAIISLVKKKKSIFSLHQNFRKCILFENSVIIKTNKFTFL